jgi:hypothetical protein
MQVCHISDIKNENSWKAPKSFPFSYFFDRPETEMEKLESDYGIGIIEHSEMIKSEQKIC